METIIVIKVESGETMMITDEKFETVKSDTSFGLSQYARFFDEMSPNWEKTAEFNVYFIKCVEDHLTSLLDRRGYVFLNEAYDKLGLSRTRVGQLVGWIRDDEDPENNKIEFGLSEKINEKFVNGTRSSALLDFNVQYILDKI